MKAKRMFDYVMENMFRVERALDIDICYSTNQSNSDYLDMLDKNGDEYTIGINDIEELVEEYYDYDGEMLEKEFIMEGLKDKVTIKYFKEQSEEDQKWILEKIKNNSII